jgi:hypothetical protein
MALVVFSQTLGGSLFLAFAQTIFSHSLSTGIAKYAPNVNVHTVEEAGAAAIRHVVVPRSFAGVIKTYDKGINDNF